jgi:hypothetical protein
MGARTKGVQGKERSMLVSEGEIWGGMAEVSNVIRCGGSRIGLASA